MKKLLYLVAGLAIGYTIREILEYERRPTLSYEEVEPMHAYDGSHPHESEYEPEAHVW